MSASKLALGAALAVGAGLAVYFGATWYGARGEGPTPQAVIEAAAGATELDAEADAPEPAEAQPTETVTAEEPAMDAESPDVEADQPDEPTQDASADPESLPPNAPQFDTFRIDPDGEALIAGRVDPGQIVAVLLSGEPVADAAADGSGAFVAFATLPPSDQPRVMQLRVEVDGTLVFSERSFIVEPFGMAPALAEVAPEPVEDTTVVVGAVTATTDETMAEPETAASQSQQPLAENEGTSTDAPETTATDAPETTVAELATTQDTPDADVDETQVSPGTAEDAQTPEADEPVVADVAQEEPAADAEKEPVTAAPAEEPAVQTPDEPTVLVADATGVRVLTPSDQAPDVVSSVALDTITYDPSGDVLLAGRARGDGFVQVYIDNQPITTSRIAEGGNWRTDLPEVDTGVYTLRIDEVAADGEVISRIETPFKREEPEAVAAVMAEETQAEGFEVAVKTVQPGSTLWAIAREQFGQGIMYVAVFEANRDLIRDPDLIYPGQVFRMPDVEQ